MFWRAIDDAVNGPFQPATMGALLDANYAFLSTNYVVTVGSAAALLSPDQSKSYVPALRNWITNRYSFLTGQLATVAAPFEISNNGGNNFAVTNQTNLTLFGKAPVPAAKQVSLTYKLKPDGSGTPPDDNLILAENVNINDLIYYKVRLTDNGTTVKIHGEVSINGVPQTPPTDPTLLPYFSWRDATFYFKAGCYYPNEPVSGTAKVTFSSLTATHQP